MVIHFLLVSALLIDNYTNFISVMLSFKYFDPSYQRLCACIDRKCQRFWTVCVGSTAQEQMVKEMVATASCTHPQCSANAPMPAEHAQSVIVKVGESTV